MERKKVNGKRILLVEDEPIISLMCERALTTIGFEVDTAANGAIAKEVMSSKEYDLCVSDIKTPVLDGMELYQHLEKEHPGLARKVVFISGDVLGDKVKTFLEQVDRCFLPKPFTPSELIAAVLKALN